MDREIVIVVPTEARAYDVVKVLNRLDDEGSIELYTVAVIVKSDSGKLTVKTSETPHLKAPAGTALGLSTGALIGLLGGPAGAAVGAAMGAAAGLVGDVAYSGFAGDFVRDVVSNLKPGSCAVCASVAEDWPVPVDTAVAPFGAVVLRETTDDIVLAQMGAEAKALDEEAAHAEDAIQKAGEDAKKALIAKRDELRAKQTARRERLRARAKQLEASWNARMASIDASIAASKAEAKARHEQHKAKLSRFAASQKKA